MTEGKLSTDFDVIIIGGGPAGLSASLWCTELGMTSLLIERETELGGQLLWTYNAIRNYLGIDAANGRELRDKFLRNFDGFNVQHKTGEAVASVDLGLKRVSLDDGTTYASRSIIIATGVRRRQLGVPGETEFSGRGILHSGAASQEDVAGKVVLIVGGGDAALENALILSEKAARVYIVHRRNELTARKEFIEQMESSPLIEILFDHIVTEIKGENRVEAVELQDLKSETRWKIAVDHVLIRIGVVPNSELFRDQIELDDSGYIQIDNFGSTSLEGSYAAGDVASPNILTISNAVGQSNAATKAIYSKLTSPSSRRLRQPKIIDE